ncbi:16480_t:CDS:1, partial [Racocetra persica]
YICFFLYCDEGYLSSVLLFVSGFVLNNAVRSAYESVFPSHIWKTVNVREERKDTTDPV